MKRALSTIGLLALASACDREPSFDERYEEQSGRLSGLAANMQDALGEQLNASIAAGRLRTDPAAPGSLTNDVAP